MFLLQATFFYSIYFNDELYLASVYSHLRTICSAKPDITGRKNPVKGHVDFTNATGFNNI